MHAANVFVSLLLTTRAAGEWVEIGQHQSRQEPSRRPSGYHRPVAANNIYANYSLTERPWHRSGVLGNTNIGSVKRVQLLGKGKDVFSIGVLPEGTKEIANENRRYESMGPVRAPNIKIKENIDNVKRKPYVDNFAKTNKTNVRTQSPSRYFHLEVEEIHSKSPKYTENVSIPENQKIQVIKRTDDVPNIIVLNNTAFKINPKIHRVPSGSVVDISKKETIGNIKQYSEENENKNKTHSTLNKRLSEDQRIPPQNPYSSKPVIQHVIKDQPDLDIDKQDKKGNEKETNDCQQRGKNKPADNSDSDEVRRDDTNPGGTKMNTVEVVLTLMKLVTDNISKTTRKSFGSKVRYLEDIRNNIMENIVQWIEQTWPDDARVGAKARRKRGAHAHLEFPSSESALMTISFLTFAVFLIKLVLQVIHTYKNKAMMVTPAVVAAVGRAAAALRPQART